MATRTNPQIAIPRATFEELQALAEIWGLPHPGLVVAMMTKQFGHLMKDGLTLPTQTATDTDRQASCQIDTGRQDACQIDTQESCHIDTDRQDACQIGTDVQATVQSETPGNTFLSMEF